jgi:multidrug transporter EmrE-like cation transporter
MNYVFLVIAFLFNSSANILLKIGSQQGLRLDSWNLVDIFRENMYFIFGLICFAANVIFYFLALKNTQVSLAYPIMVTATLLIVGFYAFTFGGESFNTYHAIGYALIIAGIVFTSIAGS